MKAEPLLKEKRLLWNPQSQKFAVAELKIWKISKSKDYPAGIKYSLCVVCDGTVIIGFDNHKPKGPHLHLGENELPYDFRNEIKLMADFWDLARKAGFEG
jgi:hypothetical protein